MTEIFVSFFVLKQEEKKESKDQIHCGEEDSFVFHL